MVKQVIGYWISYLMFLIPITTLEAAIVLYIRDKTGFSGEWASVIIALIILINVTTIALQDLVKVIKRVR